jgi:cell division protein ZipA
MPELRWILVAFGLALLIGIYVWGRRGAQERAPNEDTMFRPDMDGDGEERAEPAGSYEPSEFEPVPEAAEFDSSVVANERAYGVAFVAAADESREPTLEVMRTREPRGMRIEPSFGEEAQTAELPVREQGPAEPDVIAPTRASMSKEAPTIGMSNAAAPRRTDRRKILALRLATGAQRFSGAQLQAAFDDESLQHGKYDVFHRLDAAGVAIFSVASMVEPGTFDPAKMATEHYSGITLFAQLPGPAAGAVAFNELLACSRRLHAALGGTLQDERGVPLTAHRIERIRQEIRDFESRSAGEISHRSSPIVS